MRLQELLLRKISEPIIDTSFGHVLGQASSAEAMLVLRNVSCIVLHHILCQFMIYVIYSEILDILLCFLNISYVLMPL